MAVVLAGEKMSRRDVSRDLESARERTRKLAYGQILGAVFPISVGPDDKQKAWYKVTALRPLSLAWLPYTKYQVDPAALAKLGKPEIYRLIEADV